MLCGPTGNAKCTHGRNALMGVDLRSRFRLRIVARSRSMSEAGCMVWRRPNVNADGLLRNAVSQRAAENAMMHQAAIGWLTRAAGDAYGDLVTPTTAS